MPLPRPVPWLLLLAIFGTAGWFTSRWAREGMVPAARPAAGGMARRVSPVQRIPVVDADSPQGKWMARVRSARMEDFAALFDEIDYVFLSAPQSETRSAAQRWLLGIWSARDPETVAAFVAGRDDGDFTSAFAEVLANVAPERVGAVLGGASAAALETQSFASSVCAVLAKTSPQEFFKLGQEHTGSGYSESCVTALESLAVIDFAVAAEEWTRRGGSPNIRQGKAALRAIVRSGYAANPEAVRRWADALENPDLRRHAKNAWLGALAQMDVSAALQEYAAMPAGALLPDDARAEILTALARKDPASAIAEMKGMVEALPKGEPEFDMVDFRSPDSALDLQWTVALATASQLPDDPLSLVKALQELKSGAGGSLDPFGGGLRMEADIIRQKMLHWTGEQCLDAATAITVSAVDAELSRVMKYLVERAMEKSPERVIQAIGTEPPDSLRRFSLEAFRLIARTHPSLAPRAAAAIPERVWTSGEGEAMASSPEQFAGLVAALPFTQETDETRNRFALTWTQQDPEAAARWVASLPPNAGTNAAAAGVAEAWAAFDDTAAAQWLESLPPGATRDNALLGIVRSAKELNPELAWKRAASMEDPELALEAFATLANQWKMDAPAEFRRDFSSVIDHAGRPAETKASFLRMLEPADTPPCQ